MDSKELEIRNARRDELLRLSESQIKQMSHSVQYERMRFEREIEGNEYVRLLQLGYSYKNAAIKAREFADKEVLNYANKV